MRDQRDAARREARILGGARNLVAEFRRELAEDGRDVDPDLFEDAAVHQRHRAAAATLALPLPADEPAGRERGGVAAGVFVLDLLECGADSVAQCAKPHRGALLPLVGRYRAAGFRHSITSSARASTDCGRVTSSALAALRLTTSSNTVGRSIGRSAGFLALRT